MADLIGPFSGTAPWSEGEWYNFAPTWAPSGIIGTPASSVSTGDFAVTASGLSLTVACAGDRAWLDGSGYKPDTNKTNTVTANAHGSWSRRDRLVIRRDLAAKTITVERLPGTAADTPVAPSLTQITGGVYDIPICSFLVLPASGTTLTGFIDERPWINPDFPGGPRTFERATAPNSAISSGSSNETGFGPVAALDSFRLYGPRMVSVRGMFRTGGTGAAAECSVKINGVQVGDKAVTRSDVTANVDGVVALAAGTHTIALRVDASGGTVTWTSGRVVITEGTAE